MFTFNEKELNFKSVFIHEKMKTRLWSYKS